MIFFLFFKPRTALLFQSISLISMRFSFLLSLFLSLSPVLFRTLASVTPSLREGNEREPWSVPYPVHMREDPSIFRHYPISFRIKSARELVIHHRTHDLLGVRPICIDVVSSASCSLWNGRSTSVQSASRACLPGTLTLFRLNECM